VAKVEVGKGRSKVEHTISSLQITIPAKKNYFIIVFLGFWLCGWAFGEAAALVKVLSLESYAPELFIVFWLCGWTVGGLFAIYAWLWNVSGKEIIKLTGSELQHIRQVVGIKRSQEYDISSIFKLRVLHQNTSMFGSRNGLEFWGISGGTIAFDYGRSTHKFGAQLDEAEADYILDVIKQKNKNL